MQDWQSRFHRELDQAEGARRAGNEGKARVCARRAAGIVASEYFQRLNFPSPGPSAYERLRYLQTLPGISERVQNVAQHFLERVTPEHELPIEADLIAEARWLAQALLSIHSLRRNDRDG